MGYSVGTQENYRSVLRYAESIAGGPAALAARLNVAPIHINAWLSGASPISDAVFLRLVDVILNASREIDQAGNNQQRWHPPDS